MFTLLAVTSCSTIHEMQPRALDQANSSSIAPRSHRSVVPIDSVRVLEVWRFNTAQTILLVGALTAVIIVFVVQLGNALEHFEFPILPSH